MEDAILDEMRSDDEPRKPASESKRRGSVASTAVRSAAGLRLTDVGHAFDRQTVLRQVHLAVGHGEVVCLLGPSGCGKSTLLRLAAGLERLQEGWVEIGGRIVADAKTGLHQPPEMRRVGLMFQDFALFPHLTVFENICFGLVHDRRNAAHWVDTAMDQLGLRAWAKAYPHTLSGGQQQRCALLRALAPQPAVLLLDEPFSGLDVTLRAQVRDETAAFLRETRMATLVVTHDPEEAMSLADRLLVMHEGRIVQEGTPADIYLRPRDPFVAALFGPLNRWRGRVTGGRVQTPLGAVAAPHLAEGSEALVLIRPEGVTVDPMGDDATVLSARLLGSVNTLSLRLATDPWIVRATVLSPFLPAPGTPVGLHINPLQTFVFPVP